MFRYLLEGVAVTAAVVVYFLPAILADRKGRRNVLLLALLNALFGWTIVCWIAALYWALHPDSQARVFRIVRAKRTRACPGHSGRHCRSGTQTCGCRAYKMKRSGIGQTLLVL